MKVFIIARDLVSFTAPMVDCLLTWEECSPVVIDMASTYPPCRRWLDHACPCPVVRAGKNLGYLGPWTGGYVDRLADGDWYAVSDGDLGLDDVPPDALLRMREVLEREPGLIKVGLSLEIDDIPGDNPGRQGILDAEAGYWPPLTRGFHLAAVDTTMAVYDRRRPYTPGTINWSGRLPRPFTARHLSWYIAPHRATDEWRYYLNHVETRTAYSLLARAALELRPAAGA